jgi:hypothetical protein
VWAACGLGRSYGTGRSVLGCATPGIVECGLWPALKQFPPLPTTALITDIGNDLLYEAPVPDIAAWVSACIDRLQQAGARVVLTPLPLCSVTTLSPARFLFLRSLIFPGCRISYATLRNRALDLDERLRGLARDRGLLLAEHRLEWYGFDPIHVRWRYRARAWRELLAHWSDGALHAPVPRRQLRDWLYIQRLVPERSWLFGGERYRAQPAGKLADGTTLSLY